MSRPSLLASTVTLAAAAALVTATALVTTPASAIVGGTVARGEPWQKSIIDIQVVYYGESQWKHMCGGAVLSSSYVATADHCVHADIEAWRIVFGTPTSSATPPAEAQVVTATLENTSWDWRNVDVALLKLDSPLRGAVPVELPGRGDFSVTEKGTTVTLAGWGATKPGESSDETGPMSPDLRTATVPTVEPSRCRPQTTSFFCAGRPGVSTCFGDSGGPIFAAEPGRSRPLLLGIVSTSLPDGGCGGETTRGVYAALADPATRDILGPFDGKQPSPGDLECLD